MSELLLRSITEKVPLTEAEQQQCLGYFTPQKLQKKQVLLLPGDVCNQLAFVEKGALYSYSTDAKGNAHVLQFAFEGYWIADLYSFFTQEPSKLTIEALELSEILVLTREKHQQLLYDLPAYETYSRILYQNAYVALQRRMESTLGQPAEVKYARLLKEHPAILQRVPLHLIASYLGVTPETLSRIRKQLSQ